MKYSHQTIGSEPNNLTRLENLRKIQQGGYREKASVTAFYGADIYDLSGDDIEYLGYFHHSKVEYMRPNFSQLYHEYVVEKKGK